MSWTLLYESFGHYTAILVGLFTYRRMQKFHKLLFLQVLVALPFYFMTYAVIRYQKNHGLPLNNLWVHNLYILTEGLLLAAAAFTLTNKLYERRGLLVLVLGFVGTMVFEYIRSSNSVLYIYGFYAQCLLVILAYAYFMYHLLHEHYGQLKSLPDFWIMLGLLLYFAADAPYMMLFNYFNEHYKELNHFLFNLINNGLANTRYLLLALGFWLAYRHPPQTV